VIVRSPLKPKKAAGFRQPSSEKEKKMNWFYIYLLLADSIQQMMCQHNKFFITIFKKPNILIFFDKFIICHVYTSASTFFYAPHAGQKVQIF